MAPSADVLEANQRPGGWEALGNTATESIPIISGSYNHMEVSIVIGATPIAGFLEHPQFPLWAARKDPSSIWSSREVRLLRTLECVGITSFDQCTPGSVAVKPTTILHVRLPKFRQIALEGGHGGRCSHGPCAHERMAGRDEGGEFRTARAKIYPPGLNHALARAINSFVRSTFDGMDTSPMLPEDFSKFAVADFMPEGIVQPDYHG